MTKEKKDKDGLKYDDEGHFIYTGVSPFSEETEVKDDEETE